MNNTTSQKKIVSITDSKFDVLTVTGYPNSIEEKKNEYFFSIPPLKIKEGEKD